MSRKEYIDKLPRRQQKQLEEAERQNSAALKANEVIKNLNNDLKQVTQDIRTPTTPGWRRSQQLGACASKADLEAKTEARSNQSTPT